MLPDTPVYEIDGVHLKPPGNKMVATRMAEMLKERGWLENGAEKPTERTSGSDR
jgi:hypothetical protein